MAREAGYAPFVTHPMIWNCSPVSKVLQCVTRTQFVRTKNRQLHRTVNMALSPSYSIKGNGDGCMLVPTLELVRPWLVINRHGHSTATMRTFSRCFGRWSVAILAAARHFVGVALIHSHVSRKHFSWIYSTCSNLRCLLAQSNSRATVPRHSSVRQASARSRTPSG